MGKNNLVMNFSHNFAPMTSKRYTDFSDFLRARFPGKVQKISINAGFTCPNRDGPEDFHQRGVYVPQPRRGEGLRRMHIL